MAFALLLSLAQNFFFASPVYLNPFDEPGSAPTVSVDVLGIDSEVFDSLDMAGFYKNLLVRLVQEKLTIGEDPKTAQIVVLFRTNSHKLTIKVSTYQFTNRREVPLPRTLSDDFHLQLSHMTLDLVRQARSALENPVVAMPLRPAMSSHPLVNKRRFNWTISLDASAVWTPEAWGMGGALHTRFLPRDSGLYFHGKVGFFAPLNLPKDLTVIEWGIQAGGGYRVQLVAERLSLLGSVLCGFMHHHFSYEQTTGMTSTGERFDFSLLGSLTIALLLSPQWEIHLGFEGYFVPTERIHMTQEKELWDAKRIRLGLGVAVTYRIGAN